MISIFKKPYHFSVYKVYFNISIHTFETIMSAVRKYSVVVLILIFSISIDTKSLNRVKRHTGRLSTPSNQQKEAIERLIFKCKGGKVLGYDRLKSEILIKGISPSRMRLDVKGLETPDKHTFERYAIQSESLTYAAVHIQRLKMDSKGRDDFRNPAIIGAFRQSVIHQAHIFLSDENVDNNLPQDKLKYRYRVTKKKWTTFWVWSVDAVLAHLDAKFNQYGGWSKY